MYEYRVNILWFILSLSVTIARNFLSHLLFFLALSICAHFNSALSQPQKLVLHSAFMFFDEKVEHRYMIEINYVRYVCLVIL